MTEQLAVASENLSKHFGARQVLHNVNLAVPRNSIYGFIGGNGAGKTTTIKILLGLISATSGYATVLGTPRGTLPADPLSGVAYLPDVPELSPWLNAKDSLIMLAELSGIAPDRAADQAKELLDVVGLQGATGRVGGFSRGMKQRLGIASVLVDAPQLIILDEPTSALDPLGREMVLDVLKALHGQATVLFSSHLLADVQSVCTHVGMLDQGHLIAQGTLEQVLGHSDVVEVRAKMSADEAPTAVAALQEHGFIATTQPYRSTLQQQYRATVARYWSKEHTNA